MTPTPRSDQTAPVSTLSLLLRSAEATSDLATHLAAHLGAGDLVLLEGPVGAGKSAFARAAIQQMQRATGQPPEDVPSPSFTLVQTYRAGDLDLVHADLYRLTDADETDELGLWDAADSAVTLIEWPALLAGRLPARHLTLRFKTYAQDADLREVTLTARGDWAGLMRAAHRWDRDRRLAAFVAAGPFAGARLSPLAGDASNRRYLRADHPDLGPAVVMDAPPDLGEDTGRFIDITQRLRDRAGVSAPQIKQADATGGFLLIEDLGDALFARVLDPGATPDPKAEEVLYGAAVDLLADLHARPDLAEGLPPYDAATLRREAALLPSYYMPVAGGGAPGAGVVAAGLDQMAVACAPLLDARPVIVLRDYHAENLLWLPDRDGLARVGVLDYQDALAGHPAYDLVSLLEDARRDTSAALREAMIARYIKAAGVDDPETLRRAYATLGAQRNIKIMGIFARLCLRNGKPDYVDLMPRVWDHLLRDLAHPALAPVADWVAAHVPPPDAAVRARLRAAAGSMQ